MRLKSVSFARALGRTCAREAAPTCPRDLGAADRLCRILYTDLLIAFTSANNNNNNNNSSASASDSDSDSSSSSDSDGDSDGDSDSDSKSSIINNNTNNNDSSRSALSSGINASGSKRKAGAVAVADTEAAAGVDVNSCNPGSQVWQSVDAAVTKALAEKELAGHINFGIRIRCRKHKVYADNEASLAQVPDHTRCTKGAGLAVVMTCCSTTCDCSAAGKRLVFEEFNCWLGDGCATKAHAAGVKKIQGKLAHAKRHVDDGKKKQQQQA